MRDALRRRVEDEERDQAVAPQPAPPAAQVLALQRGAGNAAVARALMQRQETAQEEAALGALPDLEMWSEDTANVRLLQLKLNWHLGFMNRPLLMVDGKFGPKTASAVRAVKRVRRLRPPDARVDAATWEALAEQPTNTRRNADSGPAPEYDRMFEDGLLDVTLASGFDEYGWHNHELLNIRQGLAEVRGFRQDETDALTLHAAAGRPAPTSGEFFVKRDFTTSGGRPVHAVVRVVGAADGGAGATTARDRAVGGMNESDMFAYGGHARYGTGPDFNRNYTVRVHWSQFDRRPEGAEDTQEYSDDEEIQRVLRLPGGQAGIRRFEQYESEGKLEYVGHPEGNVGINDEGITHRGTLGHYLISRATRGQTRQLEQGGITERRYRLWLFNGCETRYYSPAIRAADPGRLGSDNLDMVTNRVPSLFGTLGNSLLSFLDGVMAQEGAGALRRRVEQAYEPGSDRFQNEGFEDNPTR